jgi:signal transduction histidine kinase
VVCQDIREALESRDVEAWQMLTRVLTHEMMNTLTPVMTLSRLARDRLQARRAADSALYDEDLAESIDVIHERSSGLAVFIQAYRRFSNPPSPSPSRFEATTLIDRVARLLHPELDERGIRLDSRCSVPSLMIHADAHQLEQVLINLVRNAQQALEARAGGVIELCGERDSLGRILIHVTDNGPGIPAELLDRVFVPFFTTRSGGTGIGLTLSRQLVQLNGGSLSVSSTPGSCRFTLRMPDE